MLSICVCDDSFEFVRVFVNQLEYFCEKCFQQEIEFNICGAFNSAEDVINYLQNSKTDVLFLDIDMPGMSGFELAKKVELINPEVMIIFVSGHDHYVFEVFEFFPFAYLRKSKTTEDLPGVLRRIREKVVQKNVREEVYTINGKISLPVSDVLYIKSEGNYCIIKSKNGDRFACRSTLSNAEKIWTNYDFFRVHAAYIVNMNHIQSVRNNEITIGEYNEVIPISQRRLASFRKTYAAFTMRRYDI